MRSVRTQVHTSEPKTADLQERSSLSQPIVRNCAGTTKAGDPCRSKAILESGYCFMHDPAKVPTLSELGRVGGIASGVARREQGKSVRQRLAERLEENVELIWQAFEDGLNSEDERVRIVAATAALAEAYGKPAVTLAGDPDRPVSFVLDSLLARAREELPPADALELEASD